MTIQILNDFHADGVFRDQSGTIWVHQSEMVEGMSRAWDEGHHAGRLNETYRDAHRNFWRMPPTNPYRDATGD